MAKNKQGRMPHLSVTQKLWLGVATMVVGSIVIAGMAGCNRRSTKKALQRMSRCSLPGWPRRCNGSRSHR